MNAAAVTLDWTPIIVAIVGGIFSTIGIVAVAVINKNVKDRQAAEVLSNAVKNSLGAIQQAVDKGIVNAHPQTTIAGLDPKIAVGLQYVLDHAGEEAARLGVTPEAIADKVNAKIGLQTIAEATNATTTQVTAPTPVQVVTTSTTPTAPGNQP